MRKKTEQKNSSSQSAAAAENPHAPHETTSGDPDKSESSVLLLPGAATGQPVAAWALSASAMASASSRGFGAPLPGPLLLLETEKRH